MVSLITAPRRRFGTTSTLAVAGALVLALLMSLGLPAALGLTPARAHADLVSTDPTDGAELASAPSNLVFTFSEPLLPDFVRFIRISDTGETADLPVTDVANNVATIGWSSDLGPGIWTVEYRVVSQDGHPVNGSISFTVAAAPAPTPTTSPTTSPSPTAAPTTAPAPSPTATTPAPTPSPSITPTSDTSGSTTGWLIAGIAVIGLAVVVIIGLVARRR